MAFWCLVGFPGVGFSRVSRFFGLLVGSCGVRVCLLSVHFLVGFSPFLYAFIVIRCVLLACFLCVLFRGLQCVLLLLFPCIFRLSNLIDAFLLCL